MTRDRQAPVIFRISRMDPDGRVADDLLAMFGWLKYQT